MTPNPTLFVMRARIAELQAELAAALAKAATLDRLAVELLGAAVLSAKTPAEFATVNKLRRKLREALAVTP